MEWIFLEEVESTNKYAKEHIKDYNDMTLIYTDNQTNGRGRLDRKWSYAGKDNIYASIILKPSEDMKEIYSNLTQFLCLILAQTFEDYGGTPTIKWPNDIQINGKMISGILAEGVIENGKLEGLVLGIGVNLNTKIDFLSKINQPATSLNVETGRFIDKKIFLKKLLDKFCLMYDKFIEEGFILIKNEYIRRAGFLDKDIKVKVFDKEVCGRAVGLTDDGALKLIDEENKEHVLLIGDIL